MSILMLFDDESGQCSRANSRSSAPRQVLSRIVRFADIRLEEHSNPIVGTWQQKDVSPTYGASWAKLWLLLFTYRAVQENLQAILVFVNWQAIDTQSNTKNEGSNQKAHVEAEGICMNLTALTIT